MESYSNMSYEGDTRTTNGVVTGSTLTVKESTALDVITDQIGNHIDPTPHEFVKTSELFPYGDSYLYDPWGGGYLYGRHGPHGSSYSNPAANFPSNNGASLAYNQALARLYGKVKNSPLNLAIDAFEGRETARMIRNTVKAVRGIKKFTKSAIKDLKKDPTLTASNAWLQYKYGWSPLVGTIYDALEFHSKEWPKYHVRARGKSSTSSDGEILHAGGWGVPRKTRFTTGNYRSQLDLVYQVTDVETFALDRIATLDPAMIAWELTPYSFVVDWFYNVGGYLKAKEMATNSSLSFVEGYRTDTALEVETFIYDGLFYKNPWGDGTGKYYSYSMTGNRVRKHKKRSLLTAMPFPDAPSVTCDLGSSQLISAAALLRQLFS